MFRTEGLAASYGRIQALQGVDVHVDRGELVALIGANGAGKSTLLRTVSGLVRPSGGKVFWEDADITGWRPDQVFASGIVQVPEGRAILQQMSVRENLNLGAFRRREGTEVAADLEEVYRRFPVLGERRRQLAGTLSGGEQQMLALGRALMARPRLLMLDEPSLGLAPKLVTEMLGIVRSLNEDGIPILLVEQNANAALKNADRAYVMETGKIVMEGPAEVLAQSESIQRAYLGAELSLGGE